MQGTFDRPSTDRRGPNGPPASRARGPVQRVRLQAQEGPCRDPPPRTLLEGLFEGLFEGLSISPVKARSMYKGAVERPRPKDPRESAGSHRGPSLSGPCRGTQSPRTPVERAPLSGPCVFRLAQRTCIVALHWLVFEGLFRKTLKPLSKDVEEGPYGGPDLRLAESAAESVETRPVETRPASRARLEGPYRGRVKRTRREGPSRDFSWPAWNVSVGTV
mmetsp:Transcript_22853/g.79450  ORF Transcript_22853/g.79450 Transcript_22853/m.79450 type:complete len:218 (-) Transcript_22853:1041-1694(-)